MVALGVHAQRALAYLTVAKSEAAVIVVLSTHESNQNKLANGIKRAVGRCFNRTAELI